MWFHLIQIPLQMQQVTYFVCKLDQRGSVQKSADLNPTSLRNWCSSIGKRAVKFYKEKFAQEPFKNSPEKIKAYVPQCMSDMVVKWKSMGLKFIYLDPDVRLPFSCSNDILSSQGAVLIGSHHRYLFCPPANLNDLENQPRHQLWTSRWSALVVLRCG